MTEYPVTFNVLGACVSRNIFNENIGIEYKVKGYVFNHNPYLIFSKANQKISVTDEELLNLHAEPFNHSFPRSMIRLLLNGGAYQNLIENKGDWIIVDTHYADEKIYKITYPDGSFRFLQSNYDFHLKKLQSASNDLILKNCKIETMDASINFNFYADKLADFLKENWGDKIIIFNSDISCVEESIKGFVPRSNVNHSQSARYAMAKAIMDRIDCYYVEIPFPRFAADESSTVHYGKPIFEYLKLRIDNIVENHENPNLMNKVHDRLDLKYGLEIYEIITESQVYMIDTRKRIENIIRSKNGDFQAAIYLCN